MIVAVPMPPPVHIVTRPGVVSMITGSVPAMAVIVTFARGFMPWARA